MAKISEAYRLLIDDIDDSLMSNWCVWLLIDDYLIIIHRLVIDYLSHTISNNFLSKLISSDKNLR